MPRLATPLAALLAAILLAACGTSDDPIAEVPNPPNPSVTNPAAPGERPGGGDGGGKDDEGDDDGDDDGGDGGGGGGGGRGGGGGGDGDDGGDGEDQDGGDSPPRVVGGVPSSRTLSTLTGEGLGFEPSGLLAPPGKVTLILINRSSQNHAIAIAGDDFEEKSDEVGPGQRAKVTIELPAGEYEFYCPVDDHRLEGMSGQLSVGKLDPGAR